MTVPGLSAAQALRQAIPRLVAAGVPDAAADARRLLAHAMGLAPGRLTLHLPDALSPAAAAAFDRLVAARATRAPVSHLTGTRAFWGRDFAVTPDVLDPRPETEVLVAAALAHTFARVLDLGTGSGCILLSLLAERPDATGLGTDASRAAIAVAQANAVALGLTARAAFAVTDWAQGVTGPFDLIVANPPYIALAELPALSPEVRDHEPRIALTDGGDGLGAYRAILRHPLPFGPRGRLLMEVGPTQGRAVAALMAAAGLTAIMTLPDLDGRDRVVTGVAPLSSPDHHQGRQVHGRESTT